MLYYQNYLETCNNFSLNYKPKQINCFQVWQLKHKATYDLSPKRCFLEQPEINILQKERDQTREKNDKMEKDK